MESKEIRAKLIQVAWKLDIENELKAILSWWSDNMVDKKRGGFYGRIDGHGRLYPEAHKGIILNTRILWTFSAAARPTANAAYRLIAERAWNYINTYFLDKDEGGVFWMLDADGNPMDTKKQIYAQAFALYAFAEYYLLTKNEEALSLAASIFEQIEKYSLDTKQGGYFEAYSRDWQLLEDLRLSEKDANEAKTMNTHLHILEAYTNYYRIEKSGAVRSALKNLIHCFLDKFIDPESGHLHLFFDEDWTLKSSEISFGHDIECSWLLMEAAEVLGDEVLIEKVKATAITMAKSTLTKGVDQDGALFNELNGTHLDTDKHWWPQAEAVVGFWNAWQLSNDTTFKEAAQNCWRFIRNSLKDRANGEWHWLTDQGGLPQLSQDKAGPWKAPYHNGRMCLEMMTRLDRI